MYIYNYIILSYDVKFPRLEYMHLNVIIEY